MSGTTRPVKTCSECVDFFPDGSCFQFLEITVGASSRACAKARPKGPKPEDRVEGLLIDSPLFTEEGQ